MDYDRLFHIADSARSRRPLSAQDASFICDKVPAALAKFPNIERPKTLQHPAGFSISGAPVGTYIRSALLLAGQKALGRRYPGSDFYQRVESEFARSIMGAYFNGMAPKGAFCCKQCTLAVLPVLEANAIRWFECGPLAKDVRRMIGRGEWRFSTPANPKMLAWSLAN
jgi:hypothetical protein